MIGAYALGFALCLLVAWLCVKLLNWFTRRSMGRKSEVRKRLLDGLSYSELTNFRDAVEAELKGRQP